MAILDQNLPVLRVAVQAAVDLLASLLDADTCAAATEHIGTRVNGVDQHVAERVIVGRLPFNRSLARAMNDGRQEDILLPEPDQHLTDCLQFCELGEHKCDSILDPAIRVLLDTIICLHVADCHHREHLAAPSLLLHSFTRALTEHGKLHLAHGALHAEQQPVIGGTRIVDPILVDDERIDQTTEFEQRVPIPTIAGEPGSLDRQHRTDAAFADSREQLLEPGPCGTTAGSTQIVIDGLDVIPTKLAATLDKTVLSPLALKIVGDLMWRRLSDIDDRAAGSVLRRDLRHDPPPARLRACLARRTIATLPSAAP